MKISTVLKIWLLIFLCTPFSQAEPRGDLRGLVLILDPGHGDRAWGEVPADPGAVVKRRDGPIAECVLTWDTALRVKRLAEKKGAKVFLTLAASPDQFQPRDWSSQDIPTVESPHFVYKSLLETPQPESVGEALYSRVATANRIYSRWSYTHDVYFLSLHYDSTNPDLAGISFYYPTWCERPKFVDTLESEIRGANRARTSMRTGFEYGLSQAHAYSVLSFSDNPDSYLVELANLRSVHPDGSNPDLEAALEPETREAYAQLLVQALLERPVSESRPLPRVAAFTVVLLTGCLVLVVLGVVARRRKRS